jgi:hypothetical protein
VKYRKQPFNLNKKITIQFKNTPPPKKKYRKETIQLLYMKLLIYLKKWTIVRPSCFAPKADHVANGFKAKKKKGI